MSNMKTSAKPAAATAAASPSTKALPAATSQRTKPGQAQKKKKRSGKF